MTNQVLTNRVLAILNEPSSSDWLKNAVKSAFNRDAVDALNDVEVLAELLRMQLSVLPPVAAKVDVVQVLETMTDKHGLLHMLTGLELMCGEKAAFIRSDWQDDGLAALWDRAALQVGRAARSDAVAKLP